MRTCVGNGAYVIEMPAKCSREEITDEVKGRVLGSIVVGGDIIRTVTMELYYIIMRSVLR